MGAFPKFLKKKEKQEHKQKQKRIMPLHSFVGTILFISMLECIFNKNTIISIDILEKNGFTKGQITYSTTALEKKGVIKKYNRKHLNLNFKKAIEVMDSTIWKGVAWT